MITFHFELVSPEKISLSGKVVEVDIPSAEGGFGVLAGHARLISGADTAQLLVPFWHGFVAGMVSKRVV